jgi:hypothetical protein
MRDLQTNLYLVETAGIARRAEPVRVGVPLPRGLIRDPAFLALEDPGENRIRLQAAPLCRWSDGSVRWALLDFLGDAQPGETASYRLMAFYGPDDEDGESAPLRVERNESATRVETGAASFELSPRASRLIGSIFTPGEHPPLAGGVRVDMTDSKGRETSLQVDRVAVEEEGPVRAAARASGTIACSRGNRVSFEARLDFFSGTGVCRLELAVLNPSSAWHPGGLWDLGDPGSVLFEDISLVLDGLENAPGVLCAPEAGEGVRAYSDSDWTLHQDSSGGERWNSSNHVAADGRLTVSFRGYRILGEEGRVLGEGRRALPWIHVRTTDGRWISAGVDKFWQNFPKALAVSPGRVRIGLFPRECRVPFELQGGERKRHVVWLEFGRSGEIPRVPGLLRPLVVRLDSDWVEKTRAVSHFLPEKKEPAAAYLSYVRRAVEGPDSVFAKREIIDEYGWRNFGDLYADHEAVGREAPLVSHYNNQYDFVFGAFLHYLRSGDARWRELMEDLARHASDIDIYHTDGDRPAYNHGSFWHTYHYQDAGRSTHRAFTADSPRRHDTNSYGGGPSSEHNYTTGLLHAYFLTGDPWAREAVLELAGWVAAMDGGFGVAEKNATGLASQTCDFHGPGRGAGNSINALLDAFQLTRERRHLAKAEALIRRCVHPRDDPESIGLDDPERRWSYLVFFQSLGKYLDLKSEMEDLDPCFYYARESLLQYADWMARCEVPYQSVLHKVEIPTETWPAQDIRKSCVFNYAWKYGPEEQAGRYRERARFFFDRCLEDLLSFDTAFLIRPMVLLAVHGTMEGYCARHPEEKVSYARSAHDFGKPSGFRPRRGGLRELIGFKREFRLRVLGKIVEKLPGSAAALRWLISRS